MNKANIIEYSSWEETLDWLGGVWVCDTPTVLRIWTKESEKNKFFIIIPPIEVAITTENNDNSIPDLGVSHIILSLFENQKTSNPFLDNTILNKLISFSEEEVSTLGEKASSKMDSNDEVTTVSIGNANNPCIILLRVPYNKQYMEIVGYKDSTKEILLNIESFALKEVGVEK